MWATEKVTESKVKCIVFSADAAQYWSKNNQKLIARGTPPSTSHPSKTHFRLTTHMYLKQTHDGKVIAGGDRIVSDPTENPTSPVDPSLNAHNKGFAESLLPQLKQYEIKDSWTGLMPFTKDGSPFIGKISCLPGEVYIISGLDSAGLMKGPGAGELLAELMTGCPETKSLLEPAQPDRLIKRLSS